MKQLSESFCAQEPTIVSTELGLVLSFVVVIGTVVNYNLYTWANSVLPSSTVTLFHGTNPLFTAVLSHYLLSTDIGLSHLVGGVTIAWGLQSNLKVKEEGLVARRAELGSDVEVAPTLSPKQYKHKSLMKDF